MTAGLPGHVERYLTLRRGLGYKLVEHERLLADLVAHVEMTGADHLSVEVMLGWAVAASNDDRRALRLSVARRFASYLSAFDPDTEIPPARVFPVSGRRVPHLYSPGEIAALMDQAGRLAPPLWAASMTTMVGLMAVTGIRPGEARRAGRSHVELASGELSILDSKNGRSRRLPLHLSTVEALARYLDVRDAHVAAAVTALFVDPAGQQISRSRFAATFRHLVAASGIATGYGRSARAGDLRHSFAVSALAAWHAERADVAARLPVLSAYLGHLRPDNTYWYLQAAPELMAIAADRLADWESDR